MKAIIQIPCFNEEESLPIALAALPRELSGIDRVEWLIIDDGSTDNTIQSAKKHGADHIICLSHNQGLARAFMRGIEEALQLGADIIINTDADNQYCADDIIKLVEPILDNKADIVIGARPVSDIEHFSLAKKLLQKIGSWVVRIVSRTNVADAPSGFRAFNRKAAQRINVFNGYTYTLETIIQAGRNGMRIQSVPVRTNAYLRPSRLVKNSFTYVSRSAITIFRIFAIYYPFKLFATLGILNLAAGLMIGLRFIFLWITGNGLGHVQSLILCAIFILIAFMLFTIAILADMLAVNRQLLEQIELRLKE